MIDLSRATIKSESGEVIHDGGETDNNNDDFQRNQGDDDDGDGDQDPLTQDPVNQDPPAQDPPAQDQPASKDEPVLDEFPVDRFGGKFKSWDEVNEFINKPAPEPESHDEWLTNFIDNYKSGKDLNEYFKAASVDYDKLSDEEVLKRDFFEQNSKLSDKAKQIQWKKEVAKYHLDPEEFDEEDVEVGLELMKIAADEKRQAGKELQKTLLAPVKDQQAPTDPQVKIQKLKQDVEAMPEVQKLRQDKKFELSVDGQKINYDVEDPEFAIGTMAESDPFFNLFYKEDGRANPEKWARVVEFARNEEKFSKTLIDHGKSLGRAEFESKLKNPSIKQSRQTPAEGGSFAERFAIAAAEQGKGGYL